MGRERLRLRFGDVQLTGALLDNPTARSLVRQLPVTVVLRDHNGVEKTAPLPQALSLDDAPEGHDPRAGDIGYFAPGGDLVLYHDDDAPYFAGIVHIGRFEGDLGALAERGDGAQLAIEAVR